jgi:hypothetical protein
MDRRDGQKGSLFHLEAKVGNLDWPSITGRLSEAATMGLTARMAMPTPTTIRTISRCSARFRAKGRRPTTIATRLRPRDRAGVKGHTKDIDGVLPDEPCAKPEARRRQAPVTTRSHRASLGRLERRGDLQSVAVETRMKITVTHSQGATSSSKGNNATTARRASRAWKLTEDETEENCFHGS